MVKRSKTMINHNKLLVDACRVLEREKLIGKASKELQEWWRLYKEDFISQREKKKFRQMTLEECINNEKQNKKP